MALQTLDPLALSATKLQAGGMDAQEVAYKRKAMEDDLAKTQLALATKNKEIDQKQKEADQKAFPALSETVALPYTQAWTQRMSNEEKTLAKELLDYRQGLGSNPNDPLSEAGMRRAARNASHKQYAANTNSWFKITNDLADDIRKNPGSYKDGALQEVLDAQRDITVAEKGEYPDLTKRLFDLQKHTDTILGYVKESGSGKAVTMPDGSIKTTSSEYILPADVKAGIKTALLKPEARDEALRWFSEMPKEDQDAVMEFAKNNQMSPEEAMIYNVEMPIYSYTKYKETLNAPSDGAAGRKDIEEGLNWLAEWRKGAEEGKYEGNDMSSLFGISPAGGEKLPDAYKTLKGWVFDQTEVYDEDADKNIKKETVIDAISLDRGKGNWVIKLDTGEIREIPTDKFESEVIPRLGAYNKEKLTGIGGYLNSAKKSGYFQDIQGTGTKEMVKTDNRQPATTPYVPGKKQGGAFIPGKN